MLLSFLSPARSSIQDRGVLIGRASVASAPREKSILNCSPTVPRIFLRWRSRTKPCSVSNHLRTSGDWRSRTVKRSSVSVFKDSALDRQILRKCNKEKGTIEEMMPKSAFLRIFRAMMKKAGYTCGTSIHAVRRYLGKKVDGKSPLSGPSLSVYCFLFWAGRHQRLQIG